MRTSTTLTLALTLFALTTVSLTGCDGDDDGEGSADEVGDTETGDTGETEAGDTGEPDAAVPANAAELLAFLEADGYAAFAAEGAVHTPTNGSPHGSVRVFINDTLDQSLQAGNPAHPVGSAAVKELYAEDATTRIGWAVSVKTDAESDGGQGWYWYEIINESVVANGNGDNTCIGCHAASGVDFFTTTYPLQ